MPEKHINGLDEPHYKGVLPDTPLSDLEFHTPAYQFESDESVALHTNLGSLTVLDRMTGYGGRDIESGYRDLEGKFWLASGGFDVRWSGASTVQEAIEWVKRNSNICVGG